MGAAFTFASALNSWIEGQESVREPDQRWHPSALWGCPRQAIYQYRGTPETNPRDAKSKRTLWLGSRIHEWVQASLLDHPGIKQVFTEVHIDVPELNIVGDADAVYELETGAWELGEIKSIGTFALKAATAGGKSLPKDDHEGQAETYWWALRKYGSVAKDGCEKHPHRITQRPYRDEYILDLESTCPVLPPLGDKLERIAFAYIQKDDLQPHESGRTPNEAVVEQKIRERVEYLSSFANDPSSLPPRLPFTNKKPDPRDFRCRFCPWEELCWRRDPEQVDPETDVW